ncbi:recombinase [Paenibacillus sp. DMB5]|nr:recombinase [Paenibacillus sp. DMB5]
MKAKSKKLRVGNYYRVSLEEQAEGFSLEAQDAVLRAYCEKMGYELVDVYCDDGYSGKDYERPEVQRLFKDILIDDKLDAILIWKVDRLSRNNSDIMSLIDKDLNPRKKKILVSTCDIDSSTPTGRMFISLLGTFAEYERETIIDRVHLGMDKRAELGKWNGGIVLGYDSINDSLEVNEQEMEIVKSIFTMRSEGIGYKKIAATLNDRGYRTKESKKKKAEMFTISAIRVILNNEVYIGNLKWKKQTLKGIHKPIIDMQLWHKVKKVDEAQSEAYSTNRNFKGNLFLTGILRCPKCGAGTVMSKSKMRNGEGYHYYYMCQASHSKGSAACQSNLVRREDVESKVLDAIRKLVNNTEIMNGIVEKFEFEKQQGFAQQSKEISILKKEKRATEAKLLKAENEYENDEITASTFSRLSDKYHVKIDELDKSIAILNREIEKINHSNSVSTEVISEALINFNELFGIASAEEKKALIRSIVKEIQMEQNRKDIKKITFWFSSILGLPSGEMRRTVS